MGVGVTYRASSSCAALALLTGCIGAQVSPADADGSPRPGATASPDAAALPAIPRIDALALTEWIDAEAAARSVERALDGDGDGVPNALDACRSTVVEAAVDAVGCTPFDGVIEGLQFGRNGASLDDAGRAALRPLLEAMRQHPDVILGLQGHTDNRGPAGKNLALSKQRVMAVVRFLVTDGVDPSRLQPMGYGENRPVATNATFEGRGRNRRIEVRAIMPRQETGR